jgi:alpha-beta hydrolase superfamily lysophospholipase
MEMKTLPRTLLVGCLLAVLLAASRQAAHAAHRFVLGAVDMSGELNGAPFRLRIPENWNGTLLVYAHGFRDKADHLGQVDVRRVDIVPVDGGGDEIPPGVDVTAREILFLSQGFALAGSAYRSNGYAVKEGVEDTVALVRFFRQRLAIPDRTIVWGESMGGLISARIIEARAHNFDGAIPMCGAVLGGPRAWDGGLAFTIAYDVAFGWNPAWGSIADVRDECESGVPGSGVDFGAEVFPVLLAQLLDPANFGRFEFLRNLFPSEITQDLFYNQFGFLFAMYGNTEARAEAECRAGGAPLGQNRTHFYALPDDRKAYLATLGVDADALLAAMNARTNIKANPKARSYLRHHTDLKGDIRRPVLTVHTTLDHIADVAQEAAYGETVEKAGREDRLVQVYTDGVGHCVFTPDQLNAAVTAMNHWLDTGMKPGPAFFPEAQGFVPGFVPPPWPQP